MSNVIRRPARAIREPIWKARADLLDHGLTMPMVGLAFSIALYALFFGWLSLTSYWAYQMHALDMGNMGQAAWNTIHGHPFEFTNMRLPYAIEAWRTTTRLSFHVEALFPLISCLYLMYPHPESLLVFQTLVLAVGALPVYLLARDVLENEWLGLVFALVYLFFPALEAMNLYEFHPVSLATPLLLFAFLFARRRQNVPFVACCLAAMGTKEQIGLTVAMFGLYAAVINRDTRVGLGLAVMGVGWSLTATQIIEHHFRQPGTLTYLHTRYGYLGHGVRGAIRTVLHDPLVFLRVVFTWPKLTYLIHLLAPVGFLALLSPALVLSAPTLALNLLSTDFHMYSALGDNSAEIIAVIMIAGILGARRLADVLASWLPKSRVFAALGCYLLLVGLGVQRESGFSLLGQTFQIPTVGAHQHVADKFVSMVPSSAAVSTQDQLDPHLSSRRYLYLFPDMGLREGPMPALKAAGYILLDISAPTYPLRSYEVHDLAQRWLHRSGWGVAAAEDGLILVKKGATTKTLPSSFYTYADAGNIHISHKLTLRARGLDLLGFDLRRVDLPNHPIPNLAITFYLRASHQLSQDMQPVVYEVVNGHLVASVCEPLGLAWFPTSHWRAGHVYKVRMDTLETGPLTPARATLYVALTRVPSKVVGQGHPQCAALWGARHGRIQKIDTVSIGL